MGCAGCSVSTGKSGCRSTTGCNNGCSSGGCNKLNTFDWLNTLDINDHFEFDMVEVSFKNGSRKEFFHNPSFSRTQTGDYVLVEVENGYDIGKISLSGELVRLQMKKKKVKEGSSFKNVIRKANERDMEKLYEVRRVEKETMIQARAIARTLDLDMKIGDVEYQADGRKATFFYTADGRVDFRELIRHFAKDFRVKIEMRQIGVRQESARVGGLGSCGRELCCSTWLTDFKSVSTAAARYQNLAINQSKLSGQCGRLKCCLNYEIDVYLDALDAFPQNMDRIPTGIGTASLIKTDIFKGLLFYSYDNDRSHKIHTLDISSVKEIQELQGKGKPIESLENFLVTYEDDESSDYEDVTGAIELPMEMKKKKKKKKKKAPLSTSENNAENRTPPSRPENQENKMRRPEQKQNEQRGNEPRQNEQRTNEQRQHDRRQHPQNQPKDSVKPNPSEPKENNGNPNFKKKNKNFKNKDKNNFKNKNNTPPSSNQNKD